MVEAPSRLKMGQFVLHTRQCRVGNEYILYSGFAFLCLPAFIILLFYLGLSFGVCGDRPHEEASFCNRGVGANLLLSGVVFTFLLSSLLMLVCTGIFLSGGLVQTEVCRYATHRYPAGPAVLDDALEVFVEHQLRQGAEFPSYLLRTNPNISHHLKNVASARPFSVLLTHCANESFVDSLGDEVVGMMVSDTVRYGLVPSNLPLTFLLICLGKFNVPSSLGNLSFMLKGHMINSCSPVK
ncbi:unnamed protein product [Hydatigera taeniaeformis]|uniref:Palmitoyltransferase n=1 Tax=Hydatigena taeniaeformis TaxID=6205 RepID=A0A0R3WY13_HYDTA|nr:unnamed protein product [Hydatigera taeniaeformis]